MQKFPDLNSKAVLAPMAGVTDVAFRELCKKYGAGLTYTEFISASAITRENEKTKEMLKKSIIEKPSAVQIFGSNEKDILAAAKFIENNCNFDIIDINCGCPADKIIKCGAGSDLLKSPEKVEKIIKALKKEIKKPITIKIRIGTSEKTINAFEIANLSEKAGANAITIHGRTQKQRYSGNADWEIIKEIKKHVKIPVIGNGDVTNPEIFKKRLEESGADYIMIGRAAIGNPYIFKQINDYLKTGKYKKEHNNLTDLKKYLVLAKKYNIEFKNIKQQTVWFTKGLRNSSILRKNLSECKNLQELKKSINNFTASIPT